MLWVENPEKAQMNLAAPGRSGGRRLGILKGHR